MGVLFYIQKLTKKLKIMRLGMKFPIDDEVYGIDFGDRKGAVLQTREKDLLQIVHVATTHHPVNAYVYNIELNRILGYLEMTLAQDLHYVFGDGYCLDAQVLKIEQDEDLHCHIRILNSSEMMRPYLEELPYLGEERND